MIKEQKKQQLTLLLVNKFRNKYVINNQTEIHIDRMVRDEIRKMFDEGTPSEAALNKLDKKLELMIKKARSEPAPVVAPEDSRSQGARSNAGSRGALERRSFQVTKTSELQNTGINVIKPATTAKNLHAGQQVVYEDPAAALNVSENQWNQMVQDNLKKHKENEEKVKREKYMRYKAIQEEQRRQVEAKKAQLEAERRKDMEEFNKFGSKASDIYYVHHDKMLKKQADLKGGAHQQAELLRAKHYQQISETKNRMKQEAEERQRVIQKLEEEDKLAKELKQKKKKDLKHVIDKDKDAKMQHRNIGS